MTSASLLTFLLLVFDLFTAGCAFFIFKKLQHTASLILTPDHEPCAANLTSFLYKGSFATGRALCIKRSAASGTKRLPFLYGAQALRAEIPKRAHAVAVYTNPRIAFNEHSAMDAGLFIKCHTQPSSRLPHPPQKRVPGGFCSPQAGQITTAGDASSLVPHS